MTVRTFIGTAEESLTSYREEAIETVKDSDFEPVTIESWITPSEDIYCICCHLEQKIKQEVSLFIGIFAYCYCDMFPNFEKSVAEIEFDAAVNCKTPILAFIPHPLSDFAQILQKRAAGQETDKRKLQERLIDRIYKKSDISPFKDEKDFIRKITRKITLYKEKGLRCIARSKNKLSAEITEKKIFISYADADWDNAKKLYDDLKKRGTDAWIDKEDLLPGEKIRMVIRQAIENSSYFLLLLSSNSVSKKGQAQKQLKMALESYEEFPDAEPFIIPVRLDNCSRIIHEKIRDIQCAELFPSYEDGLEKILRTLKKYSCPE